jgi:hypothetical protein
MGKMGNAHWVSVKRPEGKRPLRRSGCRREDIKMDLQQIGWESEHGNELLGIIKGG